MKSSSKTSNLLVCWRSERAGDEVLVKTIQALKNRNVPIEQVLYLVQAGGGISGSSAPPGIAIERLELAVEDPTRHEAIYELVREQVLPRLRGQPGLSVHVNISPGTPAMHAVWLILHAGGSLPAGTQLWSSQLNPKSGRTRVDEVKFPVTTYLSEIHRSAELNPRLAQYEPEAKSPARRQALDCLARYARVMGAPLLILGERGIGKTRIVETLVARLKGRKKVVTVPCGGLASDLAESFLFGHEKGAFTGAQSDRPGVLKEADGGILFLDEVQDLPQTAQRRLVRVFQDYRRRFRRLGSDREESVNVELVCASNLKMEALRKKLDPDFFDRLSHLVVQIPPLRDCREDLAEDWHRVWSELRRTDAHAVEAPWSENLRLALESHPLPGNIRDLQRLAFLTMAWGAENIAGTPLDSALRDWRERVDSEERGLPHLGAGSRSDRVRWFRGELARWAKEQFGTWTSAAKHLGCDEKTLREDAGLNVD
jgi:DNA-binding NtrC family response regulator